LPGTCSHPHLNRWGIPAKLKKVIKLYIEELKNTTNEQLRKNFRKKMGYICGIEYQE